MRSNKSSLNSEERKNVIKIPSQAVSRKESLVSNVSHLNGTVNKCHIQVCSYSTIIDS